MDKLVIAMYRLRPIPLQVVWALIKVQCIIKDEFVFFPSLIG